MHVYVYLFAFTNNTSTQKKRFPFDESVADSLLSVWYDAIHTETNGWESLYESVRMYKQRNVHPVWTDWTGKEKRERFYAWIIMSFPLFLTVRYRKYYFLLELANKQEIRVIDTFLLYIKEKGLHPQRERETEPTQVKSELKRKGLVLTTAREDI